MLDLENVKWQKEVFNLTGKNESILPPIVKSATQAGEYKSIKVIKVAATIRSAQYVQCLQIKRNTCLSFLRNVVAYRLRK